MNHYRDLNLCRKCCLDKISLETKEQDTTKRTVELARKLVMCDQIMNNPKFLCKEEISEIAQEFIEHGADMKTILAMIEEAKKEINNVEPIGVRKVPKTCPYYAEHWMYDTNLKWYERAWLKAKNKVIELKLKLKD